MIAYDNLAKINSFAASGWKKNSVTQSGYEIYKQTLFLITSDEDV